MGAIIENLLLKESEIPLSTPNSADMSEAQFAQFGEHKPLTGTWITIDELTPTDDLEQAQAQVHFFEEYIKARAAGTPYDELLTLIKKAASRLSESSGRVVSYRSLITKMSKKGIYGNKKEILEEQGIESKGRKITDDAGDYPQLVHRCSDLLSTWSKDRLLIELERRLEMHPGALFSLRCGNRLAIISLILGIKDVANELIDPDIESLFDSKPEKVDQRQVSTHKNKEQQN
jgi:hypothetical protein